jgi:hypothetical protein
MRFYVSDAHFKELCHNGSCCGLPPTWNYSRGQMCEALNICKRKGYVRWSDIKLDAEIFLRAKLDKVMNMGTREKFEVLHDERSRLHEVVLEQSAGSALAIQDVRRGNVAS